MQSINERLFGNFDHRRTRNDPDFKEDSVREVIIAPILRELGYSGSDIVRSKSLLHPYLKIGSKTRPIRLIPDYALKVSENFAWVLDAKSPNEGVNDEGNIEQVYSYATHPEIRSTYFALCNGLEFSLFRREATNQPILFFHIDEIQYHWDDLVRFLAPSSFQVGKQLGYESTTATAKKKSGFDYNDRPLLEEIPVRKQEAKRHFGVHGYFTKQSWNVVAEYIKNFTKPGDMVLDPFGGTGVTAIEAFINGRRAVSVDLNPLAVFIVSRLIEPVDTNDLTNICELIVKEYTALEPKNENEVKHALLKYWYPRGHKLPKASDVSTVEHLFSDTQLANLALLRDIIEHRSNGAIKNTLLLMFSGLVSKVNLTYHQSSGRSAGRGNASPFAYYRYRIAKNPTSIDIIKYFYSRLKKVSAAKRDIAKYTKALDKDDIKIIQGTATNLSWMPHESVDYIYTDPPYGSKIPYLDLSTMWNAWLDLEVKPEDYELEAIVGGEHHKTKESYNELIAKSIKEMYRVLKYDRWMSFVFAHKDPEFWHLIIESAESCGFEYKGAVPQKNGQTSFKKRQHPFTVLSGQLIINFQKTRKPKAIMKAHLGMDLADAVTETIEAVIAKNDGASLEQINDELIIRGLELGFLDLLKKHYVDLTPLLTENYDFDEKTEVFHIRKNTKFKAHVDIRMRIRYFLLSYLRRMEIENKQPTLEDIEFAIMPLLKNGITPENQTILGVLEDMAERVGFDKWKLKKKSQGELGI